MLRAARRGDPAGAPARTDGGNGHDCGQVSALAPAWALAALGADEATLVAEHVRRCELRHHELREMVVLASLFGEAGMPRRTRPRPCARRRLLEAARADSV